MVSLRAPVLVALLLSSAVAGCLGAEPGVDGDDTAALFDQLSQPIFDEIEKLHVQVPAADGKLQDTWVFKPKTDDPDARFPVFINFSPYWSNLAPDAETGGDAFSQYMIEEYVPRGYAIVLASVRGTGYSEGCFAIGGIAEMEAAYDVVDHFANVAWSNGLVGSGGKSYDGTTIQGLVGYKPHPALKFLFPASGISDMYRYNYRNGVPYFQGPIFNTYYMFGEGGDVQLFSPTSSDPKDPLLVVDDYSCVEWPQVQAQGIGSGAHGLKTDYWLERDYNRYAGDIPHDVGMFYVHGLQDWNVKPDHILPWLDEIPDEVYVKAWLHQDRDNGGHVYPMRDDWNQTMLRMMDHFLKGIDTGITDEPSFDVEDTAGTWHETNAWPRHDAWGNLSFAPPAGDSTDPTHSAPIYRGDRVLEWKHTVNEPLRITGIPHVAASLSFGAEDAFIIADLWLENETGRHWMNQAAMRASLRNGLEASDAAPLTPGSFETYAIPFYPMEAVFPANSTLVLTLGQIGAEDGPALAPAPLAPTWGIMDNVGILFSTVDETGYTMRAQQPIETPCWAC